MSDLISRQDAIDALNKEYHGMLSDESMKIYQIKNWLSALPSAEPKTGEWKQISPARIYECSECGQNVMTNDIEAYKFCHGCGAKMVREDGE